MRVLAAVDKFRGTVTAAQVAAAIGHACWELGHECIERPIADGGEGTLEALGGANRTTRVTDPLGAQSMLSGECRREQQSSKWHEHQAYNSSAGKKRTTPSMHRRSELGS